MSRKKYVVTLTQSEREQLAQLISVGKAPARSLVRARILLKADISTNGPGWTDLHIADALEVHERTVVHVRQSFTQRGFNASLVRKPRQNPPTPPKLNGTRLKELAQQNPRNFGKKRSTWTLQLLADAAEELRIAHSRVCKETVRKTLSREGMAWRRAQLWMTSPDPLYAQKKARRDRFMRLARNHSDWVLGFIDEVWWSRLARPPLRAWAAGSPLKLSVLSSSDDDPDPIAICCYGMLRQDTDKVTVRFVETRPTGDLTAQFLDWICRQLEAERKKRFIVVWDDASWHSGGGVAIGLPSTTCWPGAAEEFMSYLVTCRRKVPG